MIRVFCLSVLASLLVGCFGVAHPHDVMVFNRTPDKVTLEIIPVGDPDPLASPNYQKHELLPKTHKEIPVVSGYYSLRAIQDDWEGEIRRRIDRRIEDDATITIMPGCFLEFLETPDPLLEGLQD